MSHKRQRYKSHKFENKSNSKQSVTVTDGSINASNLSENNATPHIVGVDESGNFYKVTTPNYTLELDTDAQLIKLKNGNTELSSISVATLNDEATKFVYNQNNNTIDLQDSKNKVLSSIPVNTLVQGLGVNLTKEGTNIKLTSNNGSVLSTVSLEIDNVENLRSELDKLQTTLVSGTNIKTINNESLLGSGNIDIEGLPANGNATQYLRGDKTWQTLDSTAVGLGNVDNTSDVDKPISRAVQEALDKTLKADNLVDGYLYTYDNTATKFTQTNSFVKNSIALLGDFSNSTNVTNSTNSAYGFDVQWFDNNQLRYSKPWPIYTAEQIRQSILSNDEFKQKRHVGAVYLNSTSNQLLCFIDNKWQTLNLNLYDSDGSILTNRRVNMQAQLIFDTNANPFKLTGLVNDDLNNGVNVVVDTDGTLKTGQPLVVNVSEALLQAPVTGINSIATLTTSHQYQNFTKLPDYVTIMNIIKNSQKTVIQNFEYVDSAQQNINVDSQQLSNAQRLTINAKSDVRHQHNMHLYNITSDDLVLPINQNWVIDISMMYQGVVFTATSPLVVSLQNAANDKSLYEEVPHGVWFTEYHNRSATLTSSLDISTALTTLNYGNANIIKMRMIFACINQRIYRIILTGQGQRIRSEEINLDINQLRLCFSYFNSVHNNQQFTISAKKYMIDGNTEKPEVAYERRYEKLMNNRTLHTVTEGVIAAANENIRSLISFENGVLNYKSPNDRQYYSDKQNMSFNTNIKLPKTKDWAISFTMSKIGNYGYWQGIMGLIESIDNTIVKQPTMCIMSTQTNRFVLPGTSTRLETVNDVNAGVTIEYAKIGNIIRTKLTYSLTNESFVGYSIYKNFPDFVDLCIANASNQYLASYSPSISSINYSLSTYDIDDVNDTLISDNDITITNISGNNFNTL